MWIDVCPRNPNLLAAGGAGKSVSIYDKRSSRIVEKFLNIHSGIYKLNIYTAYRIVSLDFAHNKDRINCVRWDARGNRLVSASQDGTAQIIDFASGKVSYTSIASSGGK